MLAAARIAPGHGGSRAIGSSSTTGEGAGQTVFHLHAHLARRTPVCLATRVAGAQRGRSSFALRAGGGLGGNIRHRLDGIGRSAGLGEGGYIEAPPGRDVVRRVAFRCTPAFAWPPDARKAIRTTADFESTVGLPAAGFGAGASRVTRAFSRRSRVHLSISSDVRRSRTRARSSSSRRRAEARRARSSGTPRRRPAYSASRSSGETKTRPAKAVTDVAHDDDLALEGGADLPSRRDLAARIPRPGPSFSPKSIAQRCEGGVDLPGIRRRGRETEGVPVAEILVDHLGENAFAEGVRPSPGRPFETPR